MFEAEVALVAAPVFVTDKDGKAVAGLTAEDFEIQDGGKRVPVVAFQAIDVNEGAATAAAPPPNLPVAVQAAAARQFVLVFDLQFSSPPAITRARMAATRFVRESLAPSDLVAVAAFGREGLRMLTGLTTDRVFVARAIEAFGFVRAIEPAADPLGLSGAFDVQAGSSELADREIAAEMASLREALMREYQHRVTDFVESLEDLAGAVASLRGRKQVVLLSGGFTQLAWAGSSAQATPEEARAQNRADPLAAIALRDRMNELYRKAGLSDVAFHTIDLAGIEGPVDVSSPTGRNASRGEGRLSLAALADNTGGLRVRPTNDFGIALREVDAVSRHYYVLAFQPADPAPKAGRPRDMKVRVKREGLFVSHRAAYVLPKAAPAPDAPGIRLAAAEAIAKGLSGGPLGLRLVTMPYRDRQGGATLPAVLQIDGEALAAAARGGPLQLQVYGYALAAGQVLDSLKLETTLDLAKAGPTARRDGVTVLTTFAAASGPVDLRFFVRAGASGQTGSIRRQVEVPPFAEGQPVLSGAMSTVAATGRIVAPTETHGRPPLEIPFRLGAQPFLPDLAPTLTPGRPSDLLVFAWPPRGAAAGALEVTGEIARSGEAPLPLRIGGAPRVVPDPDGFDRYVVSVVPPPAATGEYQLRLMFREPATGRTARSEAAVVVHD